ncbi:DUF6428 family protein [Haloferula sp. BvORR071]|uniref:DUF6428 family protein n=1 Tax=Haloferula sp. BvORR071 TaxID=1396141 RepID=UPI0005538C35|nr:DUF6428 family protein [Haloferula sp. BvORR071]
MTLAQLKALLAGNPDRYFRIRLPDGSPVPLSFHVTEVGCVQKTFLDCGGTLRESVSCQLQVWVGQDYDHRIETRKMAAILDRAKGYLPDESVPVEVEYEDRVISQYAIADHEISEEAVVLVLAHKHTECLAPELCGLPPIGRLPAIGSSSCCGPSGCC